MNYKIITDVNNVNKNKWSEFVFNHPHGNIFQTPEMYEVYNKTKNYEPVFLAVSDNDSDILGTLLAVIQKEYFYFRKFKHYTIKTPFMRWSQAWMFVALSNLLGKI